MEEEVGATGGHEPVQTIVIPRPRMPSPDDIIKMMKDGEDRLRLELARRAAIRKEEERVSKEKWAAIEAQLAIEAATIVRNRTPEISTIARSETGMLAQPSSSRHESQPMEIERTSMYDRLIRTVETAQRKIAELENRHYPAN